MIVAVVSRDGALLHANRAFINLLPGVEPDWVLDVRFLFVFPAFATLASGRPSSWGGVIYLGSMGLGTSDDMAWFEGSVYEHDDDLFIVGEVPAGLAVCSCGAATRRSVDCGGPPGG